MILSERKYVLLYIKNISYFSKCSIPGYLSNKYSICIRASALSKTLLEIRVMHFGVNPRGVKCSSNCSFSEGKKLTRQKEKQSEED